MSDVYEGRNAAILESIINGTAYTDPPQSRIEELLIELKQVIEAGGGGVEDYGGLTGKPQINNVTLASGNNSASDLGLQNELTFDNAPTENSDNPVKSGGIFTALSDKQDSLTFDSEPTENSNNPARSGGIFSSIKAVNDKLYSTIAGRAQNNKGSMELNSVDLNTIITSGFYNAVNCINAPFENMALIVCGYYLAGYCFQLAANIQTGEVKTRVETNSTWGAWSESNKLIHS